MKRKLFIDAGSTKMEWVMMEGERLTHRFVTSGYNPNYAPIEKLEEILFKELPVDLDTPDDIAYYGTGCGSEANCVLVHGLLKKRFPEAEIFVSHDMMGAAVALFGAGRGIACILGTGANSCLYDGGVIVDKGVSLGYLVGDEGSGCYIGRKLVRAYYYGWMPHDLQALFEAKYELDLKAFIDKVYHQPEASKYLAGFTRFAGEHQDHPFVRQLVKDCLDEFIEVFVMRYRDCRMLPIGFVGSVAFHFQDILRDCLASHGLRLGKVLVSPLDGLR